MAEMVDRAVVVVLTKIIHRRQHKEPAEQRQAVRVQTVEMATQAEQQFELAAVAVARPAQVPTRQAEQVETVATELPAVSPERQQFELAVVVVELWSVLHAEQVELAAVDQLRLTQPVVMEQSTQAQELAAAIMLAAASINQAELVDLEL
jgi:hypothetical protein